MIRDLTKHERATMWLYGEEYSRQNLGIIDYYKQLPVPKKNLVRNMVKDILKAQDADD